MVLPARNLTDIFPAGRKIFVVIVFALSLATIQVPAGAAMLASLLSGGFIDVGQTRFSNWELISLDSTAAVAPLTSLIFVNPLNTDPTRPGLTYLGNSQLATLGINAIDLTVRFRVQTLSGGKSYVGQSLDLTNISIGAGTGLAYVSEQTVDLAGTDLASSFVVADNGSSFFQFSDSVTFAHRFSLTVDTNIFLTGLAGTDTVNVSTFTQRFSQTGPLSLSGDFDFDGDVDGRDFLIWQRGGSPIPNSAADLAAWQANYGAVAIPSAAITTIPEPSTVFFVMLYINAILTRRQPLFG